MLFLSLCAPDRPRVRCSDAVACAVPSAVNSKNSAGDSGLYRVSPDILDRGAHAARVLVLAASPKRTFLSNH